MTTARVARADPTARRLADIRARATVHPFWRNVSVSSTDECWLWRGKVDQHGYGYESRERSHRVAWEVFHRQSLEPGDVVRHSCDTPACCNPLHLTVGTQVENVQDRVERARGARGAANGRAKLTEDQVLAIFRAAGTHAKVAAAYGVSEHTAKDIRLGRSWAWLTGVSIPTAGI